MDPVDRVREPAAEPARGRPAIEGDSADLWPSWRFARLALGLGSAAQLALPPIALLLAALFNALALPCCVLLFALGTLFQWPALTRFARRSGWFLGLSLLGGLLAFVLLMQGARLWLEHRMAAVIERIDAIHERDGQWPARLPDTWTCELPLLNWWVSWGPYQYERVPDGYRLWIVVEDGSLEGWPRDWDSEARRWRAR